MNLKTGDLAICTETSSCTIHAYSEQGLLGPDSRQANSSYRAYDPLQIPQEIKEYGRGRTPETYTQPLPESLSAARLPC